MADSRPNQISGPEFARQIQDFALNTPPEVREKMNKRVEELRKPRNPASVSRVMNAVIG